MPKSTQAFRTISEVADDLDIQKHVLRFWESKFTQLKPMKRGGGRRYYRPEDVELLRGIHHLLRSQAYTIKGVQRILREQGAEFVKACWQKGAEGAKARTPQASVRGAGLPVDADAQPAERLEVGKPRKRRTTAQAGGGSGADRASTEAIQPDSRRSVGRGAPASGGAGATGAEAPRPGAEDAAALKGVIEGLESARASLVKTRASGLAAGSKAGTKATPRSTGTKRVAPAADPSAPPAIPAVKRPARKAGKRT